MSTNDKGSRKAGSPGSLQVIGASLETVCGVKSRFPDHTLIEYAFAGKSNVGKSSLINALMQRRSLARTSATPGKTQTVNFYKVDVRRVISAEGEERLTQDSSIYFVDLPGYGYTKASESVKADWGRMVERYLKHSRVLKMVFLLVDIRHKPSEDDRLMYSWIREQGFRPVVIATKADKLGKNEKVKAAKLIRSTLELESTDRLILFSAETREGREEICSLLFAEETAEPSGPAEC